MRKIHFHFSSRGFSNSYLIGPPEGGAALLVDPGQITVAMLRTIEDNGYEPEGAVITHGHPSHTGGLRTLRKIYDLRVFSALPDLAGSQGQPIEDGVAFSAAGLEIEPMVIGGHSADSVVYRIGSALFTGDVLSAGCFGTAPNSFAQVLMVEAIRERLFALPGGYFVYPGHGPPSTIAAERVATSDPDHDPRGPD